jgi:hypothetical protein
MPRARGERGTLGMDDVRRSIISKDLTEEDPEDREIWRSKISLS